ncbi:nitroreductase [Paenibacillus sp. CGMCC 1.16610]|uniref:Putative NAD(P)H nitroreductase n=1 Tax=Paenibacillus anseongense TaxID=2682845 RepID=A0ABW9UDW1_9BACL|nr:MULTISPECIES: nitroreductase [Paenibacillus]MBA2942834.1 nitroreductase [Paenibacillus sp. CGMCC 1.16610]MVQ38319.1 nitroreductase [Paenibacillus anseongense]
MSLSEYTRNQSNPIAKVIKSRRTIRTFKDTPVSDELLLELLNVAIWAPNHENRQPWRFLLYKGEGRVALADAMLETYSDEEREQYGKRKREYFLEVPVHLIVVLKEDRRQKQWDEDYAAACALIQNFQLAAWEQGLGVVWKTNHYNYEANFREAIGIQPEEKIVGVLHIGYPEIIPPEQKRTPAEELLTIIDK